MRTPGAGKAKRVTRADVARLAGVSTATVSYVLNASQKVPERTAKAVWDAVRRLDYRPNLIARSLATNETKQLAIVLYNMANPINADLILGFEGEAIRNGYFVNICTGNRNLDDYFDNFASRRIDGLFIDALPSRYHVEKVTGLVDAGIKVVTFGNFGIDPRLVSRIETDYPDVMHQAVAHLVELGHRDIAYVSGLSRDHTLDRRIAGFRRAVRELTGSRSPRIVAPSRNTMTNIEDGTRLTARLLESGARFTALVATNDLMAIGAMHALAAAGLRVPRDVSVVGIDGTSVAELCTPPLTSVATDHEEVGRLAFLLLHADLLHGEKDSRLNRARLVVRDSTAPAPPAAR